MHYFYFTSLFLALFLFISACAGRQHKAGLTEDKIEKYITAYARLRERAPDILEAVNSNPDTPEAEGQAQFENVQAIITDAGLENYAEFVLLNAKIGAVFSIIQSETGLAAFDKLQSDSVKMIDDSIRELQVTLEDPDVPEETREELRGTIKELEKSKEELQQQYKKNEKWASLIIEQVKRISGFIVSDKDIELVKKYENQLMEAYTGFPTPYQTR